MKKRDRKQEAATPPDSPMNGAALKMRTWSQCLIAYEVGAKQSSEKEAPAAFVACEKLSPHLATFMGTTGVHALVSRAHALARGEVSSLEAVSINSEGIPERLSEVEAQFSSRDLAEGRVILLARLLGLLLTFIGESLTRRIMDEVWPKLLPNNPDRKKEGENEKRR